MTPSDILRAKLNLETAQLGWPELERHFARGDVIKVEGRIARAGIADAEDWHTRQPMFWAVVVAPWVLVQEAVKQIEN
ncbi:MAG: hypothetical protein ABS89_08030 [Thiobacillus sp. SCN 63-1177]|nr:MAG: hypothetical protein ABS89_08030 [Thiobacillus sp. SCN 63-1177]